MLLHPLQAVECRLAEDAAEKLSLALRVVDSQSARERLEQWRAEELEVEEQGVSATSNLMLPVLRLTVDELGFRWEGEEGGGGGIRSRGD